MKERLDDRLIIKIMNKINELFFNEFELNIHCKLVNYVCCGLKFGINTRTISPKQKRVTPIFCIAIYSLNIHYTVYSPSKDIQIRRV